MKAKGKSWRQMRAIDVLEKQIKDYEWLLSSEFSSFSPRVQDISLEWEGMPDAELEEILRKARLCLSNTYQNLNKKMRTPYNPIPLGG
jgi:hypothetical protein